MKKKRNGFTLVELLAVIIVLAIIMVLTVPTVLNIMSEARKDSFLIAVEKYVVATQNHYIKDSYKDIAGAGIYVYDIKTDLDAQTTGGYNGYIVVNATNVDNVTYHVFMYDKYYQVVDFNTVSRYPEAGDVRDYNADEISSKYGSSYAACHAVGEKINSWDGNCYNKQGYIIKNGDSAPATGNE